MTKLPILHNGLFLDTCENHSICSPVGNYRFVRQGMQVIVTFAGTDKTVALPKINRCLINPANHARELCDYRGGCWIADNAILVSVWEYFPTYPLFVEFQVGRNGKGKPAVEFVDAYRLPTATNGGCVELMGFDPAIQEVVIKHHMSESLICTPLINLRKNRATASIELDESAYGYTGSVTPKLETSPR
jgi:hypothetical protein